MDVVANVTGLVSPIQTVTLTYLVEGDEVSVDMTSSGDDEYTAQIALPGQPAIVNYYIVAVDGRGVEVVNPEGAPTEFIRFQAGPDNEGPSIEHLAFSRCRFSGGLRL